MARELTWIKKEKIKRVYQLKDEAEFRTGEWIKLIPPGNRVEFSYISRNCILTVVDTPKLDIKQIEEYREEVRENGK